MAIFRPPATVRTRPKVAVWARFSESSSWRCDRRGLRRPQIEATGRADQGAIPEQGGKDQMLRGLKRRDCLIFWGGNLIFLEGL